METCNLKAIKKLFNEHKLTIGDIMLTSMSVNHYSIHPCADGKEYVSINISLDKDEVLKVFDLVGNIMPVSTPLECIGQMHVLECGHSNRTAWVELHGVDISKVRL